MKRLVVMITNGRIDIYSEEDLEVLITDRDGTHSESLVADERRVSEEFAAHEEGCAKKEWPYPYNPYRPAPWSLDDMPFKAI